MKSEIEAAILKLVGASQLTVVEEIQSLWSGYGQIVRVRLDDDATVVVKHVKLPVGGNHPRGWNTDSSHRRKVRSYEVEAQWYADWSSHCAGGSRVPACLGLAVVGEDQVMVLEDLDAAGYPVRRSPQGGASDTIPDWTNACLDWLAEFHATFMGETPEGLWPVGTYWHLDTRPDELESLDDPALKVAAGAIDARLSAARFQTFVHGDAKLANFCFSENGARVAAVDFQYVGGGCGMKDVAYFIGSCFDEEACERLEQALLDRYFSTLLGALKDRGMVSDADALEEEWRELFPYAWADFHRFLKGWSPGHWKLNSYSERMTRRVLEA